MFWKTRDSRVVDKQLPPLSFGLKQGPETGKDLAQDTRPGAFATSGRVSPNPTVSGDAISDAIKAGDVALVKKILALSLQAASAKDSYGMTPLHWAAATG